MIPAVIPFTGLDVIFAICAIIGGVLFVLRLLLTLIGFGHDGDMSGMDVGHVDVGGHDIGGSHAGFQLLSINGVMGFFMIFGLLGLALRRGSQVGDALSVIGGFAGGVAMMAVIGKMFQFVQGLAVSGNIDYRGAIGQQATIYLHIPDNETGQVEVCINNRMRILDAVSEDHKAIKTGERVDVVDLLGANTLIVRRR